MSSDTPETAPCKECDAEITKGAQECPECGYDPAAEMRRNAGVMLAVGANLGTVGWFSWPLILLGGLVLLLAVAMILTSYRWSRPATGLPDEAHESGEIELF